MAQQPQQGKPIDLGSLPANEVIMIRRSIEEVRLFPPPSKRIHFLIFIRQIYRMFNIWKIHFASFKW
jgi:hypothetical protein